MCVGPGEAAGPSPYGPSPLWRYGVSREAGEKPSLGVRHRKRGENSSNGMGVLRRRDVPKRHETAIIVTAEVIIQANGQNA